MLQIRKEDNQKKQKEKKLKVYKVNTHKKTVIALWVLLAVSFLFAVYKNFTAIDIHTVHETKVIEETILDTHKIENFVENFAEVYYSWEQSTACPILDYGMQRGSFSINLFYLFDLDHRYFFGIHYANFTHLSSPPSGLTAGIP